MENLEYQPEGRTELSALGEFALIDRLTDGFSTHQKSTIKGVGDDCAVVGSTKKKTIISSS